MSLSIAAILAESARRWPQRTAVVCGDERVGYAALWEQACRYGAVLAERGIGPGDRVALLLPNVTDFPRAYYGALAAGAVIVPVHALLSAEEIAYVLRDSGAALLICAGPLLGAGAKGAELAGVPVLTVLTGSGEGSAGHDRLDALAAGVVPLDGMVTREPYDEAVILYTSGTTGQPKGAILTHHNIVMNATISAFDCVPIEEGDVVLGCLPLFHSFGQTVSLNGGLRRGATIVMVPRFDGATALDLMVRERVTVFHGVPTMYLALLDATRADDRRPPLRVCISGGASLPVAVLERFEQTFGARIYEGYGLSETSPVATTNQPAYGIKPGTVGVPIWGVEVQIAKAEVEDRIELLPVGELGEVVIRGHNIFSGYLNRPEATAAAIVDGWFRSGDLGTLDTDGFLTIVDRKKDMILRGGYNVYPREVEEVLVRHPSIAQVAVVGIPDAQYGEEICAVVVRAPAAVAASEDELRADIVAYAREHLAKYKYPRQVRFVDALPLGPSGKVLKRELSARLRED